MYCRPFLRSVCAARSGVVFFDSRYECSLSTADLVVLCWAWPLFLLVVLRFLLLDETQIWLGDLRVVGCSLGLFVFGCFRFSWITARTRPQCYVLFLLLPLLLLSGPSLRQHRPHRRGKKNRPHQVPGPLPLQVWYLEAFGFSGIDVDEI